MIAAVLHSSMKIRSHNYLGLSFFSRVIHKDADFTIMDHIYDSGIEPSSVKLSQSI